MEFTKFSSLENTYNAKLINMVREQFGDKLFIVTEKIHGANFAFYYDGENLQIASRNQFVDTTFFACAQVVAACEPKIKALYKLACAPGQLMVVYGELAGDGIQKEVEYGAKNFYAFELVIDGEAQSKAGAFSCFYHAGLPHPEIIYVGDFENALAVKETFQSYLTPEDYDGENEAEGVVIEPVEPSFFANGKRVYLKKKTESFSERKAKNKAPAPVEVPENVQELFTEVSAYLTENRVKNVISKLGEVGKADFGKVLKLTVEDAIEDFEKDTERHVGKELQASTGWLNKLLAKQATSVVRAVFLPLVA